jgi:2-polyprenyl-3-methyl-5-hydroxy-6-metoxy-1,4-benzoquinol methylase
MARLEFNDIHTQKKQEKLREMMVNTVAQLVEMDNGNPVLDFCPICSSPKVEFFVNAYQFDMTNCMNCGLLFCNPYPSQEQICAYYNSEMKSFENEFFRDSFEKRINIFLPRVELIQKHKAQGKLLDVGSAIGIFIEALHRSKASFDLACCDMSEEACKELGGKYPDLTIYNKDYLDLDVETQFDVITLWDTLEHIVDSKGLLQKTHQLLKDDGIFVFSTPNTDSFEWICAQEKHVQILPPGHVNLMNWKCIDILLKNNFFRVVDAFTLNASLDLSYVKKLIEKNEVAQGAIGNFLWKEVFDPDFELILEQYLVSKKKAGNIVVIAQKI